MDLQESVLLFYDYKYGGWCTVGEGRDGVAAVGDMVAIGDYNIGFATPERQKIQ